MVAFFPLIMRGGCVLGEVERAMSGYVNRCPSCGSTRVVADRCAGELVCAGCGLVLGAAEFAPPPERVPGRESGKLPPPPPIKGTAKLRGREFRQMAMASGARVALMVGRPSEEERCEVKLSAMVEVVAARIGLLRPAVEEAKRLAKALRKACRGKEVRLTLQDCAAVGVWLACRRTGFPLTMKLYRRLLRGLGMSEQADRLYKLLSKASRVADGVAKPPDVKAYIRRIAEILRAEGLCTPDVEAYAYAIAERAKTLPASHPLRSGLCGRNPVHVAAACLCAADRLMAGGVGVERIAAAVDAGGSVLEIAKELESMAPPLSRELAERRAKGSRRTLPFLCADLPLLEKAGEGGEG